MKAKTGGYRLKRDVGLFEATFYGVGIILGAGVYVLIGAGAGIAGNMLWLSFGVAALVALFTAFSYAELSSMFPKEAAEFEYTRHAFGRPWLAFAVQWTLIVAGVISAATVALGFGAYFNALTGMQALLGAVALIVGCSLLNWRGIRESARFNILSTLIEIGGLVIVIAIGASMLGSIKTDFLQLPQTGFGGILSAAALVYFAFIGFENVANIAEETKQARRIVPTALMLSLAISTALYMLVSVFAVGAVGWEALAASKAPLASVAAVSLPSAGVLLAVIALFATSNTVLIILITVSRMIYGMSSNGALPGIGATVGKRGTPYVAVAIAGVAALAALSFGSIDLVARLTDIGIFLAYLAVNAALVKLRFTAPGARRAFKAPLNIGKLPLTALLGIVATTLLLAFIEPQLWLYEALLVAVGLGIYAVFSKQKTTT